MHGFREQRRADYIWPGFVDALAALLMVLVFLIMVFTVGQFHLGEMLGDRDRTLDDLRLQIDDLAQLLSLEKEKSDRMSREIDQLSAGLSDAYAEGEKWRLAAAEKDSELERRQRVINLLGQESKGLQADLREYQKQLQESQDTLVDAQANLDQERQLGVRQRDHLARLTAQIGALREQLQHLAASLDAAEQKNRQDQVKIADLGRRLNVALAGKVQELSRYRSEFFARLLDILGRRSDVKVVGDRFVFPSSILFDSASAELAPQGKEELRSLAATLVEVTKTIPDDIEWVLRIDGHTDARPINTDRFASNWHLSNARALSVVAFLIEQGIEPRRLAAAGFSQYHPLDPGLSPEAQRRNRRIEMTLTRR